MQGNLHVRFLGNGAAVTPSCYPVSQMYQITKSFLAFMVAPLVPVLFFSGFVLGPDKFIQIMPLVAVVTYGITLIVALPIYLFMLSRQWLKWWHFALFGVIPALPFDIVLYLMSFGQEGGMITLRQWGIDLIVEGKRTIAGYIFEIVRLAVYALIGVVAGIVFWFVAHRGFGSNKALQPTAESGG